MPLRTILCATCGKEYTSYESDSKYCSRGCFQYQRTKARKYIAKCPVCGNDFKHVKGTRKTCSNKCYGIYLDDQFIAKMEAKLKEPFGTYLRRRYVHENVTAREIQLELGLADNHRRFLRILSRYNIEPRTVSQSVALMHRRNPHRGDLYSKLCSDPEKRLEMAAARQRRPNMSSVQKAALSVIRHAGFVTAVPEYAVDKYNIDIALPEMMVGIEINGGCWHSSIDKRENDDGRDRALESMGWTIRRFTADQFGEMIDFIEDLKKTG